MARLVAALVAVVLSAGACANRGFDEDATPATDSESSADTTPDSAPVDEPADGTGVDAGADADLPVGAVVDPAALSSIEPSPCLFDAPVPLPQTPVCYRVSVPEDWASPDSGDQVVLQVAVFEADTDAAAGDATIYLDGGPGGSTLDLLWTSFPQLHQPQTGQRDYIVFDQRGVGRSEPTLTCPEMIDVEIDRLAGRLDDAAEREATITAVEACRTRLEADGVELDAYNSVASANDVEAIRSLLGYDRLNLLGVSYGTRLAQSIMRMYPDSVRAAVLDSIVPVESDLWTNLAPEAKDAFEQLFQGCAEDPACAEAHPDLENRFFAVLDRLDAEPIEVEFTDLLDGASTPAVVDGDELMGLVFSALYDRSIFSVIPAMVGELENGDTSTVEFLGSVEVTNFPYVALGQRLSVECNEELVFEDEADLTGLAPTEAGYDRLGTIDGDVSFFDLCRAWPAGEAPIEESEPVVSDIPTLLLAGRYDPITRPTNADIVAANLANSYRFVLPNEGHGIVSTTCGASLVVAFLDQPDTEPDGSCVATSPAPTWVPGQDGADIELVDFRIEEPFVISGVRPAGWLDAGSGVFARQSTALDPTSLIVQPTGGIVGSFVVDLLSEQLEVTFQEEPSIEAGGRTWDVYRSDDDPAQSVRLAVTPGTDGVMVVVVASAEEIESLRESVFLPVIDAAVAG